MPRAPRATSLLLRLRSPAPVGRRAEAARTRTGAARGSRSVPDTAATSGSHRIAPPAPAAPWQRLDPSRDILQLLPQLGEVVRSGLDAHEEAVEGGDVQARGVEAGLERLDERRPGARKWIEDVVSRLEIAVEQNLDELRNELAVIGVEPVDMLRPHPLGKLGLRPGEVEVQRRVQLVLRDGH